uniref:5-formyltetrahydrofolate cyclo-ligase n=2 Tax=Globodera rostochiensis TaxID=31243 RepID=A0A914H2C1_GLORO
MSNTPHLAKKILRKEIRGLIAQQMAAEGNWENIREKESASVVKKLFNNEWFLNAKRLSIYISNEQEICTDDVVRKALREGKEVFIPRFKKGAERMEMLRLESETEFDSLESTLWGELCFMDELDMDEMGMDELGQCHRIRQHPAHFSPPTLDETPAKKPLDLVVMPGLAFTTSGKRLGHGRGFYDRFLNDYAQKYGTAPKTIGLALKVQLVDDLPMESKDRMVDLLIHA